MLEFPMRQSLGTLTTPVNRLNRILPVQSVVQMLFGVQCASGTGGDGAVHIPWEGEGDSPAWLGFPDSSFGFRQTPSAGGIPLRSAAQTEG